ncbi:DUF2285 domain-containing protein [Bosea vestrisii]|uniref:DUF2285 domain-containing protein n=1 Tax=Bosea vestrisii TaxID=151416 RepID=UPI0024DFD421|nr:DUF2285 domain-containing protein [Bosea vestrisii]WID99313.1 DUF2285 domain-containing protein [Bosea vestrisii]
MPPLLSTDSNVPKPLAVPDALITQDGAHHLHDLGNGQRVHIVQPADTAGDQPLAALIPLGLDGFDRVEAVARLLASLHGRVIPPDTRLTRQQLARARRMLRAVDGARDGATQQEIAKVIFRTGKLIRDEWQAASARHAVMSLLRDARAMIAGGYRKLLRHRRRP